ncbi:hypothetical protein AAMO2058_000212500 [Amorphochlora amoebiformis]
MSRGCLDQASRGSPGNRQMASPGETRIHRAIEQQRRNAQAGSNLNGINAILLNNERRILQLKQDIKIDDREIAELEDRLIPLRKKREDIEKEISRLLEHAEKYGKKIEPLNEKYADIHQDMRKSYLNAKKKCTIGMKTVTTRFQKANRM